MSPLPRQPSDPEVLPLVTFSGELRRATAPDFEKRLLEHAARAVNRGVKDYPMTVGLSPEQLVRNQRGSVLIGAGAAVAALTEDDFSSRIKEGSGLNGDCLQPLARILRECAAQLFVRRHEASTGFVGFLPGLHIHKNTRLRALGGTFLGGDPIQHARAAHSFHHPLRCVTSLGDYVDLYVPGHLLAVPEGGSRREPVSSRDVHYTFQSNALLPGTHHATQAGLGVSHPDAVSFGRWFPSGKQSIVQQPDGSRVSNHPVIYIGRVGIDETGTAHCDTILMCVNLEQDGRIDFIGNQAMKADLSSLLRWDLWERFAEWANIQARIDKSSNVLLEVKPRFISVPRSPQPSALSQAREAFGLLKEAKEQFSANDLQAMEQEIEAARQKLPRDKASFIEDKNALFDVFRVRIVVDGKAVGRFKLANGYSIRILLPGGKTRPFRTAKIKLALMDEQALQPSPSSP